MYEGIKLALIFGIGIIGCWSIQLHRAPKLVGEHTIYKRQANANTCQKNEFGCDRKCINATKTCNGYFECDDERDESWETCHERNCSSTRFRCKSGGCIHQNKLCDGFKSCVDSDDETVDLCRNHTCPAEKFRCDYGGCIRKTKVCNKNVDCWDGSDETEKLCASVNSTKSTKNTVTPASTTPDPNQCVLPPVTADKSYVVSCPVKDRSCGSKPGERVPEFSPIISRCNAGYAYPDDRQTDGRFVSTCLGGSWAPSVGKCKKICDDLRSLDLNLTCYQSLNGLQVPCTSVLVDGAAVIPRCRAQHHPPHPVNYRHVICRPDGTWNQEFVRCLPDCGRTPSSVNLIVNAEREKRGESPWNVAIYSSESSKDAAFICGGTLISVELVVSAAHCFYDLTLKKPLDARFFSIVVAKATLDANKVDYPTTKTFKVKKMFFPTDTVFTGESTNYASDIVVLHLSNKVTLSEDVLPACVYWNDNDRFNPGENTPGKLSGFGVTENETLASNLMTAKLPYISYSECLKKVSADFSTAISIDKFCAGYVNGPGARVGDSGGGLVFLDTKDKFFYLRGVVSNKDLTSSSIATFTDVAQYITWIKRVAATIDHSALDEDTLVNLKFKS